MLVKRFLPINFRPKDSIYFGHELEREISGKKISKLKKVYSDNKGYIFNFSGIRKESYFNSLPKIYFFTLKIFIQIFLKKRTLIAEKIENGIWFCDKWSDSYFHWFSDALPRLFYALEESKNIEQEILIPHKLKHISFVNDSLQMLGKFKIKWIGEKEIYFCKNLLIADTAAPTGNFEPEIMKKIREKFHQKLVNKEHNLKVYISRGKTGKRKILNEEKVEKILIEKGFKTYYFEEMSFEEQANICFNASHLISNHGAGLTNMLFMNSKSKVFEFRHEHDNISNCYFSLASALEIDYYYQICETTNSMTNIADILVDINLLKENLKSFVS